MLSGILNSDVAINVNINIMRAFVMMRQYALNYQDLATKILALEQNYNKQFANVYEALDYLNNEKAIEDNRPINRFFEGISKKPNNSLSL